MFILGSTSPRRRELFSLISKDFKTVSPTYDEETVALSAEHYALAEAEGKANSLKNLVGPEDCLITCDTIVVLNGKIYGKPKDHDDAVKTLQELSGNTHQVISGYVIIYKDIVVKKEAITNVTFNKLSIDLIEKYIKETNVYDKAGSYAAQDDKGYNLVREIDGSFHNVMGFPVEQIITDLKAIGALK